MTTKVMRSVDDAQADFAVLTGAEIDGLEAADITVDPAVAGQTDVQAALTIIDFYLSGTASALSTHAGAADPHPGYLTPAEGSAAYDAIGAAAAAQSAAATDATTKANAAQAAAIAASDTAGAAAAAQAASWPATTAFDATAPTTAALGDAAAAGSAAKAAHRDHLHGMPALGTTAAAIGTSAGGSATTPSKSDHVHATGAGTPSTQAFGDAAATGSGPAASMTDHKHGMMAAVTRASLGLDTTDSPQLAGINVGDSADTTLARASAGVLQVEGKRLFAVDGADVPVADGGTGASTAAGARTNLGLPDIPWTLVTKAADESLNTNTTVQNDDELFFATTAGGLYEFECRLIYASPSGAGTPDMKIAAGEDTTSRGMMQLMASFATNDAIGAGGGVIRTGTAALTLGTAAAKRMAFFYGNFLAVGGTFVIQWAQNTSDANNLTVYAGSILTYRRVV